jgi:uncharacterized protein (TIGR02145 family)
MGFIRNFEIWNNQRPRICSFDIDDYCNVYGAIGNTCTENTTAPDMGSDSDPFTTSRATFDAWGKAVVEYFTASLAFYYDYSYVDSSTGDYIIPEGLLNEKCNSRSNFDKLCNLFYGYPHGFYYNMVAFRSIKAQINNSFIPNGDPAKLTGVHTFTELIMTAPRTYPIPYTYTIDFTNYQSPDYNHYLEYRTILGNFLQWYKKLLKATAGHPLTPFEIPPICSGDVVIGNQTWTQCNLSVTKYRNGDPIPYVEDPVAWAALTTGAWCYYDNNPDTEPAFGKLYNWYAINDSRGLAPEGYHVPTRYEWQTLIDTVGGNTTAGKALKQIGSLDRTCVTETNASYWQYASIDFPTNSSFFTALPGGYRDDNGSYSSIGYNAFFWNTTEYDVNNAYAYDLGYSNNIADIGNPSKKFGMSIRVVKDKTCAEDVTIGSQVWTRCNLDVTTYRNGDVIPQVTDPTQWQNLTTGAWCYYNNDPLTEPLYGKLYNWYAVNDLRGLAIDGYHVPSDTEWTTLETFLGGNPGAGGKLKEIGISHWIAPNTGATDQYGFTALPGGVRPELGDYGALTMVGYWWTATQKTTSNAWMRGMSFNNSNLYRDDFNKAVGYSVRLMKD